MPCQLDDDNVPVHLHESHRGWHQGQKTYRKRVHRNSSSLLQCFVTVVHKSCEYLLLEEAATISVHQPREFPRILIFKTMRMI